MSVPVKNGKKPSPPPEKKYTRTHLEKINRDKLRDFCKKRHLPYGRVNKSQIIDNILLWQEGKELMHPELVRTWEEVKNGDHIIAPYMRKFCIDYVTCSVRKTTKEWAAEFGVSPTTIRSWLSWSEMKELIETFRLSIEKRVTELFAQNQEVAVIELVRLITTHRVNPETRRKAIVDLLGFAGRINANSAKVNVIQQQVQGQDQDISNLTSEQLNRAIKEMDELNNG